MHTLSRRLLLASAVLCGLAAPLRAQPAEPLPVLATFSILADITRAVGGARVRVDTLVGPDQDSHGFQPSPGDARKTAAARLIIANGLGFEPYLERLLRSAGSTARRITVTDGIKPMDAPKRTKDTGKGHAHAHEHDHGTSDPHAWQSIANVRHFAAAIAAALTSADPAGAADYAAGLQRYTDELAALDAELRRAAASIPEERRVLITTHNAFRYLAAEYGLRPHALQGVTAEAEPSAAEMARIIRQLRTLKAPAVFLENVTDPRKLEQIARESGAKIGGTLYSDALSLANGPAPTYIDMMRHNMREIVKALAPQS